MQKHFKLLLCRAFLQGGAALSKHLLFRHYNDVVLYDISPRPRQFLLRNVVIFITLFTPPSYIKKTT